MKRISALATLVFVFAATAAPMAQAGIADQCSTADILMLRFGC